MILLKSKVHVKGMIGMVAEISKPSATFGVLTVALGIHIRETHRKIWSYVFQHFTLATQHHEDALPGEKQF